MSIQDAGLVPGMIPEPALPNRFVRQMRASQARITPPPLIPLLTPKTLSLDATSL